MHTKNFRIIKVRQTLDVLEISFMGAILRDEIYFGSRKDVFLCVEDILIIVFLQDGQETHSIPVIAHPTSIVDVPCHVEHSIPRHVFFFQIQKHLQGFRGNAQITVIKFIPDVET